MYKPKLEKDIRCPLEYGLNIFGGKWKSRIICVLAEKECLRYSLLRKEMYSGTLVKTKIDKFLNVSGSRHCSIEQQCREVALCWRDVPDG